MFFARHPDWPLASPRPFSMPRIFALRSSGSPPFTESEGNSLGHAFVRTWSGRLPYPPFLCLFCSRSFHSCSVRLDISAPAQTFLRFCGDHGNTYAPFFPYCSEPFFSPPTSSLSFFLVGPAQATRQDLADRSDVEADPFTTTRSNYPISPHCEALMASPSCSFSSFCPYARPFIRLDFVDCGSRLAPSDLTIDPFLLSDCSAKRSSFPLSSLFPTIRPPIFLCPFF